MTTEPRTRPAGISGTPHHLTHAVVRWIRTPSSMCQAPAGVEVVVVTVVTLIVLALTGFISAALLGTSRRRSSMRLVFGGAFGLALTYGVGSLFG